MHFYIDKIYMIYLNLILYLCRVDDIHKMHMQTYCRFNKIPLLGWGIANKRQRLIAECCDNVILN